MKTRGATGVWDPRTARMNGVYSRANRRAREPSRRGEFETRLVENADCLPVANRRARRRFEKGLRRSSEGRRGGRASLSARTFHGVGSSPARARGRGGGRDGGRAPRGEARDARLRGAGDAARAGGRHAFNELGFFERVCVSSRGARRRKERRAGTRTRHEAGPSRGDETRAWRRASKWPVEEQDAKYRRRLRSDPERKALFEVHFSHCSAPSNIETFLLKTGCA